MSKYDFILDKDCNITRVSAKAEARFGITTKNVKGLPFFDLIKTEYIERIKSAFLDNTKEFCFIRSNMGFWSFAEITPSISANGTVSLFAEKISPDSKSCSCTFSNLTDFIENIHDIYYSTDIYGNLVNVSPSVFIYTGYSYEELIGKNLSYDLYLIPELREKFKEAIGKYGSVSDFEIPIMRKDGSILWISSTAHFIKNMRGEIIGIEGIAKDITETKAERESLIESMGNRYQTLFESATDSIFVLDLRSKQISDANTAMRNMTGYTLEEIKSADLMTLHPKYEHEKMSEIIIKKREGILQKNSLRVDFLNKHGEIIPTELTSAVINENGKKFCIAIARDISERLEKDRKNREQEQMLIHQSKMAAMGEMISNIAHQWRQPLSKLSGILMNIEMAQRENETEKEKIMNLISDAYSTIRFMSDTIDDFKNFFSPGKPVEEFRINTALSEVLVIIEPTLQIHNIKMEMNIDENVVLDTYKNEFCQVLLNLIQNAKDILILRKIKDPKIEINVSKTEETIKISVSDNGGGIEHKAFGKIFDPYFTTKPEGQGIGLYMSKIIIEKNIKGSIIAKNTLEGAEFIILIKERKISFT